MGGATSTSSMQRGLPNSQAMAALHLITWESWREGEREGEKRREKVRERKKKWKGEGKGEYCG